MENKVQKCNKKSINENLNDVSVVGKNKNYNLIGKIKINNHDCFHIAQSVGVKWVVVIQIKAKNVIYGYK